MVGTYAYSASRKRLLSYYKSICSACLLSCCSHNISPIVNYLSVETILNGPDISLVEKALELDSEYKDIFKKNIKTSLQYLSAKGFPCDFNYLEENDYDLRSIVTVYRDIDERIEVYNNKMKKEDFQKVFDTCFFIIPGTGCLLENYRPTVCKIAFRNCFNDLSLYDFVEGNIRKADSSVVLGYIKRDFEDCSRVYLPKIIIGATEEFKNSSRKFMAPFMIDLNLKEISYLHAAQLADFLAYPARYREKRSKFIKDNIIDKYPEVRKDRAFGLIFADNLVKEKEEGLFGFGMEWLDIFKIENLTDVCISL